MNFNKAYFCPNCRCKLNIPSIFKQQNINFKKITLNCGICKKGTLNIKNPNYKEIQNLEQNELQNTK